MKDDDPGCQSSYIIISNNADEFSTLSDEQQAQAVADTMWELIDDDPYTYEDEISMYADIVLNR